jgi:hypothetical protein
MVLRKLEELGYKPVKEVEKKESDKEITEILKEIEGSEAKKEILELLIEALSESDPRELLIYGMYVKKTLVTERCTKKKDVIEKTMELLKKSLGKK